MATVIGYLVIATLAVGAALLIAGPHHVVRRDPTFELEDVSGRQVPILGALAGFAVTGVVFLVTQARMDRLRDSVFFPWIIAVIGFPIGGVLAQQLAGPAATVPAALVSGLVAGAAVGFAQASALRLRPLAVAAWVGGTAAGLAVALGVVTGAIGQIETTTEAIVLGVVSGALIGVAQSALLMRAGVRNAWAWIPVTAVAWAIGWLITASVGVALAPGWPVYGLSGAIVSQLITGAALWRLVPSHDRLRATA